MPNRTHSNSNRSHHQGSSGRSGQSRSSHSQQHSRRGFAAMDRDEQREIARRGGQASHGGQGRSSQRGGTGSSGRYQGDDNDNQNERSSSSSGRRGFAAMDPDEQREIARRGGEASHGGQGRSYESRGSNDYDDDDYNDQQSSRNNNEDYDDEDYEDRRQEYQTRGQGQDWQSDSDDDGYDDRRSSSNDNDNGGGSRRGFASMDPQEQREISRRGGQASHRNR
jgi:general stress protein YciG